MKTDISRLPQAGNRVAFDINGELVPVNSFRDFYAFEQHVKAARARRGAEMIPEWYELAVFYFSNHNSMLLSGEDLPFPPAGEWLDFELEVGCVIGKECRNIKAAEADEYIAGYTVLNDWSLRDAQRKEMKLNLGPAKGKDFATTIGPQLVSLDELEDKRSGKGYDLVMTAQVNGKELSRGNWKDIHYSFGEIIERASQGVTLYPGDVLGSGTVGTGCILELGPENTGGWLKVGDVVELEIERLGLLRNKIVEAE
ncbi:fumarylacetoacetate hydrolase family protein [bacterium]|nr:fumarylacetoacetate hydrolase family protein [bacterium]